MREFNEKSFKISCLRTSVRKPEPKRRIQLSHPVGIGSDAVKYMWIMKACTDALFTAGAARGPWMSKVPASERGSEGRKSDAMKSKEIL